MANTTRGDFPRNVDYGRLTPIPGEDEPHINPADPAFEPILMLLRQALEEKASDLHLRAGSPPRLRIDGDLFSVRGFVPDEKLLRKYFQSIMSREQTMQFDRTLEMDFSHHIADVCRVRVNLYKERGAYCASLRLIPNSIPTMEEIQLPAACNRLVGLARGLVLVSGPTGSGKSTTIAAMLNHINSQRRCHILTVEDPIEYYYEDKKALVSQRELDIDTKTFSAALRHSFRQDPDVVLLGEMRDLETIQMAITLAETGHLTFSTLHTGDCTQTITRIVDVFPPHQQDQVRSQLAISLEGAIAQHLLKLKGRRGRIAVREVMICNRAIRNLIREGKYNQLYSAIQTGTEDGMMTMDSSLMRYMNEGLIDYESALAITNDPRDFASKFAGRA